MSVITKVIRRLVMKLTELSISKSRREIRHAHIEGFQMLVFANEDVGRLIYNIGSFEPKETAFFKSIIQSHFVCLDIGGNVGYFTMLMAKYATQGVVHVFEPIAINAAIIRTNAELNEFANVTVNNVAVGDKPGIVKFTIASDSAYSSMHSTKRRPDSKVIDVPIITLDEYLLNNKIAKIDLMKVDVEGAEEMVVRGAQILLSDPSRRPSTILIELYNENLVQFGTDVTNVIQRMLGYGYTAHVLVNGQRLKPYSQDMANRHYNIIFIA